MRVRRPIAAVVGDSLTALLTAFSLAERGWSVELFRDPSRGRDRVRRMHVPVMHSGLIRGRAQSPVETRRLWTAARTMLFKFGIDRGAEGGVIRHTSRSAAESFRQHARLLGLSGKLRSMGDLEARNSLGEAYATGHLHEVLPDVPLPLELLLERAGRLSRGAGVTSRGEAADVGRTDDGALRLVTRESTRVIRPDLAVVCGAIETARESIDRLGLDIEVVLQATSVFVLPGHRGLAVPLLVDHEAGLRLVRLGPSSSSRGRRLVLGPCDCAAEHLDSDELLYRLSGSPMSQLVRPAAVGGSIADRLFAVESPGATWVHQPEDLPGLIIALPGHDALALRTAEQIVDLAAGEARRASSQAI